MAIAVPVDFERAVLDRVRSGEYASTDDVFAACLEMLEREETDYAAKLEWLQRELDIAEAEIEAGEGIDSGQAFAQALQEYHRRVGR